MRSKIRIYAIFGLLAAVFTAWFAVLIPWDKLPDPDAFYHATMADLFWKNGPAVIFPWLDLTTLGKHFADQHFLLHVIQSPFVHFLGLAQGSRVSSLILAVICMMGVGVVIYKLRLKPFWLWILLLAVAHPFTTRLVLGKATPLAVLLWLAGLAAATLFAKSRSKSALAVVSVVAMLFVLTHGGWIILPGSLIILYAGGVLSGLALHGQTWLEALKKSVWQPFVASAVGVFAGIILHPGRRELFDLLWIQVLKIGLLTPSYRIPMGQEWDAASPGALLAMTSAFGIVLLLVLAGLIFARQDMATFDARKPNGLGRDDLFKSIVSWGLLLAVLSALTLKSTRYAEYFQPALAVWTAMLVQLVDWNKLQAWLSMGSGRLARWILPGVVVLAMSLLVLRSTTNAYGVLHEKPMFMDDQYLGATQAISLRAQPGDRVYHSQWDEFPVLFSRDQRLRYVAGLDPNFFYEASSTLATRYFDLAFHAASSTQDQAWQLIHDQLGAKFAMVDTIRWPDLAKLLESDPRYIQIGEGQGAVAYQLRAKN